MNCSSRTVQSIMGISSELGLNGRVPLPYHFHATPIPSVDALALLSLQKWTPSILRGYLLILELTNVWSSPRPPLSMIFETFQSKLQNIQITNWRPISTTPANTQKVVNLLNGSVRRAFYASNFRHERGDKRGRKVQNTQWGRYNLQAARIVSVSWFPLRRYSLYISSSDVLGACRPGPSSPVAIPH